MPTLTIIVNDDKGQPVNNASVYLFAGSGGIDRKENAALNSNTGIDGKASFTVSGFYRVGIYISGYVKTDISYTIPDEWKNVWTCWGAVGVGSSDIEFPFEVAKTSNTNSSNPIIWVVAGVGIIAVITMGVLIIRRSKKK